MLPCCPIRLLSSSITCETNSLKHIPLVYKTSRGLSPGRWLSSMEMQRRRQEGEDLHPRQDADWGRKGQPCCSMGVRVRNPRTFLLSRCYVAS